jgi:uncharacterized cupin superfamily protein
MTLRALVAAHVPPRTKPSNYPPIFAAKMTGRVKRILGDAFGLKNFGVNLVRLAPGGLSALHHRHARQDEFVYVLEGTVTLVTDDGEQTMGPGSCVGFKAGGSGHHFVNRGTSDVVYLEVGDRTPGDTVEYPNDDIAAAQNEAGAWVFTHKDGTPW